MCLMFVFHEQLIDKISNMQFQCAIINSNLISGSIFGRRYQLAVCQLLRYHVKCLQAPIKAPAKSLVMGITPSYFAVR